jgi:hypothetical protein
VAEYARHEPEKTLLHQVVREQLEGFLASARYRDQAPPRFVEQELRSFLRCGVLAHGFLRLHCDDCGHDRLVAFSCKRRGFCPSCGGRRMADTATHLVDRVLPEVPIRQWVLTLPYQFRYRCAYDARLTSAVLRAFIRALFAELRRRARKQWETPADQCGAVTFIQRFGSALNLNVHFHTLALDGVYTYTLGHGGAPRFLPLPPPGVDEVARVLAGTARRIQRLVEARAEDDAEALARDEPLMALLAAASLRTRIATGAHRGEPWRRLGDRVEPREGESPEADPEASARVPEHGGMSLHADVAVPERDRRRLERLCRYVARPPLASERLEEGSDGTLALRLKSRWRDGTTHILMERSELIERLVPLIPPPRAHQVRYHGILAPGASQRDGVVPNAAGEAATESAMGWLGRCAPPPTALAPGAATKAPDLPKGSSGCGARRESPPEGERPGHSKEEPFSHPDPRNRARRMRWAALLQRVFEVDALRCPRCGSTLRLIAAIEDPMVARRILDCLELPARAPPLAPAAADAPDLTLGPGLGPDQDDRLFDQSPAHDEPDILISGS